ncbi:hypothetical protein Bbelb_373070 [Branchiostoma belcheri]|nr:hypothetical protein Bbelb_373070 [Branchiostoma belcheri]
MYVRISVDSRPHRGELRASYAHAGNDLCDLKKSPLSRLWIHNTPPLSSTRLSQTDLVTLKRKTVLQKAVPSVLRLVERPIDRTSAYRGRGAVSDPGPVRPRLHTTPPPSSTFFDRFGESKASTSFCVRTN